MRYVGVDLAWTDHRGSGLVVLDERGRVQSWAYRVELDAVASFCLAQTEEPPTVVAIDAPLTVPNETGHRAVDRALMRLFAGRRLGVHAASRRRLREVYGGLRGERLVERLAGRGCQIIEVYPHAALIAWSDLPAPLAYKRGSRDERLAGLQRLVDLLRRRADADPPLDLDSVPWLPEGGEPAASTAAVERMESLLDALICAHVAAFWHRWGTTRCARLGDGEGAYLVTPLPGVGGGAHPSREDGEGDAAGAGPHREAR